MKLKLLLSVLLFTFLSHAQIKSNDKKILQYSSESGVDKSDYTHYLIIKDYKLDQEKYQIFKYSKKDTLVMQGTVLDKNKKIRDGEFIFYYDNGNKKEISNYDQSKLVGKHEEWYKNGNKKEEGIYSFSKKDKESDYRILNFWNEDNIQTVSDGNGIYKEPIKFPSKNDSLNEGHITGVLKNGKKIKQWTGEIPSLKLSFIENYNNGKFVGGISKDSIGEETKYTKIYEQPQYKNGPSDFYHYIGTNFKVLDRKTDLKLKIITSFYVNKLGEIEDIKVVKGANIELDREAVKVLKKCEKWKPGRYRGQLAEVKYTLPISLKHTESVEPNEKFDFKSHKDIF